MLSLSAKVPGSILTLATRSAINVSAAWLAPETTAAASIVYGPAGACVPSAASPSQLKSVVPAVGVSYIERTSSPPSLRTFTVIDVAPSGVDTPPTIVPSVASAARSPSSST